MLGKLRTLVGGAALALVLCNTSHGGVVCEAIGKGWDKAVGKAVKAHEAAQAHLKESKHLKGMTSKLKPGKLGGGCSHCR